MVLLRFELVTLVTIPNQDVTKTARQCLDGNSSDSDGKSTYGCASTRRIQRLALRRDWLRIKRDNSTTLENHGLGQYYRVFCQESRPLLNYRLHRAVRVDS